MRKLSALLLNKLSLYIFSKYEISTALSFYLRLVSLVFIVSIAGILYQFNDLFLIDQVYDPDQPMYGIYFNLFSFIPVSFFKYFLYFSLVSSVALFFFVLPFWLLFFNFIVYTSLILLFPTFMSFQWDILMVETLLFSLLLVHPLKLRLNLKAPYVVSYLQLLPILMLMVRLFFHSGVVKLLSNDFLWLTQSVLDIHLFSQPLPHFLSFYIHALIVHLNLSSFLTQLMFIFELILPFFLLIPMYRKFAASLLIFFQVLIILTGNYGFFNFLVISILVLLLLINQSSELFFFKTSNKYIRGSFMVLLFVLILNSVVVMVSPLNKALIFPTEFSKLRLFNRYGLFANMTTNQTRYQIHLSNDGILWNRLPLKHFNSKGFPNLTFLQPYHPRIRWQLWFKFINEYQYPLWYQSLIKLIAKDPNSLPSITVPDLTLSGGYQYIKLCYQSIVFNYDRRLLFDSNYWLPIDKERCHTYDVSKETFYVNDISF
tara:strand:- start:2888 stop:4345 length:1458 start_codon:yes stop_codon:yes gene_type:complete